VRGFEPRHHCAACLRGRQSRLIRPGIPTNVPIQLGEAPDAPFIYLCGVAGRWADNLHVAMRPGPGRIVAPTYNGLQVQVVGAEAVTIPGLPEGYGGLGAEFTACRNYQFGVAYFGVSIPTIER